MHEREAVRELGREMGASRVDLLAEPLLAALGLGLPVLAHQGEMVVDLGAGTSEAAIFSGGGSVVTAATRIGGDHLTDAIIQHLFVKNHWVVGHHAAEELKAQVGSLDPLSMQKALPVVVQNTVTGLPKKVHVTGSMILEPISHYARQISELVSRVLEECPPELSGDLTERGLHLSGGAALLHGLDAYLSERLGLQVRLGSEPRRAVSMGGAKVLNDLSLLERLQVPL
jgi:rod shape-determining protein MreB